MTEPRDIGEDIGEDEDESRAEDERQELEALGSAMMADDAIGLLGLLFGTRD